MNVNLLALDIGEVRIGVAIKRKLDPNIIPMIALPRAQNQGLKKILEIIKEESIDLLVVGLPLSESNEETDQSKNTRSYVDRIRKRSDINVVFIDEYCSSLEAVERLNLNSRDQRKVRESGKIDSMAASIILEYYLKQHEEKHEEN